MGHRKSVVFKLWCLVFWKVQLGKCSLENILQIMFSSVQMQTQPLSAVLPHPLVHVTIRLSEQTQQQPSNFMYKSRPAEFKGAGLKYVNVCRIRILDTAWNLACLSASL